jgi:hypothetical protein
MNYEKSPHSEKNQNLPILSPINFKYFSFIPSDKKEISISSIHFDLFLFMANKIESIVF